MLVRRKLQVHLGIPRRSLGLQKAVAATWSSCKQHSTSKDDHLTVPYIFIRLKENSRGGSTWWTCNATSWDEITPRYVCFAFNPSAHSQWSVEVHSRVKQRSSCPLAQASMGFCCGVVSLNPSQAESRLLWVECETLHFQTINRISAINEFYLHHCASCLGWKCGHIALVTMGERIRAEIFWRPHTHTDMFGSEC